MSKLKVNDLEINSQDYYLSSIDLNNQNEGSPNNRVDQSLAEKENNKDEVKDGQQQVEDRDSNLKEIFLFLGRFLYSFGQFLVASFAITTLCLILLAINVWQGYYLHNFKILFWALVSSLCAIYTMVNFFFLEIKNEYVFRLYQDGIFFIFSALLVYSFLKAHTQISNWCGDFTQCFDNITQLNDNDRGNSFRQKYQINETNIDHQRDTSMCAISFNNASNSQRYEKIKYCNLWKNFDDFSTAGNFSRTQFLILILVVILKLTSVFSFIYVHSLSLKNMNFADMILIILVYVHTSHNLLRSLGSYDLKRKEQQMKYLISLIDFQETSLKEDLKNKLDITDSQSLEEFDNARKMMFELEKEYLERLDYAYIGLIFYYFFVIIICASFYFEFEWLISKESSLVNPIWVLISTGNFIFLTAFLMFRFKHGTDFNSTFSEFEMTVDNLLDIVEDLTAMYDHYFFQKQEKIKVMRWIKPKYFPEFKLQEKEVTTVAKDSAFGLLVKKIKLESKEHINNKTQYSGRVFENHEKTLLRKEMLSDMKRNLKKVKKSIQTDSKLYKYQFLGLFEVDLTSFLITVLLGVVTSLPSIIPKFIQFYKV